MDAAAEMAIAPDAATAYRVVKKIDRVIIPLLFVTYMLNFMDKTILSSAAVFGLREDNVSWTLAVFCRIELLLNLLL